MTKKREKYIQLEQKKKVRTQLHKRAFDEVVVIYEEIKPQAHAVSYSGFYKRLKEQAITTQVAGKVFFSPLDFICDVELCARLVVDEQTYKTFTTGDPTDVSPEDQEKIGREFVARRLFPWYKYFTPTTIGRGKHQC